MVAIYLVASACLGAYYLYTGLTDGEDEIAEPSWPEYTSESASPSTEPSTPGPFPTTETFDTETSDTDTSTTDPEVDDGGSDGTGELSQEPSHEQMVEANPLYDVGPHASVGCRESGAGLADRASVEAYYSVIFECLNRAWEPQVREAGAQFERPSVMSWSGSIETPCGTGPSIAFYCPTNRTIYMKWDDDTERYNEYPGDPRAQAFARMAATHTAAHEFAHHVQELTGILGSYHALRYEAITQEEQLEYSRRAELQASCLGDVFLGANQPSYPITGTAREMWQYLVENSGDEYNPAGIRDHGSKRNHGYWAKRGFTTEDPGSCNTFTAPSSQVS